MPESVLMCWSGGKDSAMALREVLRDPALRVEALLTTVTADYERISMHGVRVSLLEAQARALGLPLEQVRIPVHATNEQYDAAMREVLTRYQTRGVRRVVFGDLFLEDIRRYREERLATIGMEGIFPLWGRDTRTLSHTVIQLGFKAVLVCVDPKQIDPSLCGRDFDWRFLADVSAMADPCGERGEFHTFVHDGPIFASPVAFVKGERVERDGFWFCDLDHPQA